ncbi:late competence protein [Gracilibacillus boraciitolerans JCM 21714]|uniref:Late competence protein n=1 Tax=Gracilibacillus boraciitolerans JCM 21714 TaxID=1298598 RepID=W4VED9_9BACI|nr:late competence protein ComER [Gracilibacillus boraciitolerans]GAE91119.1 late competence protein [Gracilibacillus boraciitolerans JCM 21714]
MKWGGLIGTGGNMGGEVLITAFLESELLKQEDLYITNRTIAKAYAIQEKYPSIHVKENIFELINEVDTIFLCVKPADMIDVLNELKPILEDEHLLVSITSALSICDIESIVNCQVARMVPSITNYALAGVTLVTFGQTIDSYQKELFLKRCHYFSEPLEIEENIMRIASDIVSCGPAFFAFLAENYIQEAINLTEVSPPEQATLLMEKMFIGFGKLLAENHFTLNELIDKVCVKGGVTGVGIASMEKNMDGLFKELIQQTHHKFKEDKEMIAAKINH